MSLAQRSNHRLFLLILYIGLLIAGILLRIWSFQQNTRLYGDLNLFALTARQLASQGQLTYPMKYDYTPQALYLSLESPASQHPPLWPLLGAILARLCETTNTFQMLKFLSFFVGLCLWVIFLPKAEESHSIAKWMPFGLIALSPWLVDFSANGSPYILITLILILAERLWKSAPLNYPPALIGIAALCALAILTHNNLTLLPLSFVIRILVQEDSSHQKKALSLGIFCATLLFLLSPWLAWNWRTFGQWFHTPSSYYLLEQLGMTRIQLVQDRVMWTVEESPFPAIAYRYSLLIAKSTWAGLNHFIDMVTPLGFLGIFIALGLHLRQSREEWSSGWLRHSIRNLTSPLLLYLLTILLWATYKARFLIPLLPTSYLLISESISHAERLFKERVWLIGSGVALFFLLTLLPYRQEPLNLYYGAETPSLAQPYDQMKRLAEQLQKQPAGVVLGVSESLDGGIETIYWAQQPFVRARGFGKTLWKKLADDFNVRYIWSECRQEQSLSDVFPTLKLLLADGLYCVFLLP